jgi:RNA polymerase sigma-70 factor (ECF subfamily)
LLAAAKHFLAVESRRARTQKRGGGKAPVPLDFDLAATGTRSPAQIFERRWALTIIERAMQDLRNMQHFDQLKGCLMGKEAGIAYADLAKRLGLTEGALKVKIHRMRRRFGELLRAEIAQTVESEDQIGDELRYLLGAISS